MWHDGVQEKGHAGVGKIAYGMTGCREKVMPEWEKRHVA